MIVSEYKSYLRAAVSIVGVITAPRVFESDSGLSIRKHRLNKLSGC